MIKSERKAYKIMGIVLTIFSFLFLHGAWYGPMFFERREKIGYQHLEVALVFFLAGIAFLYLSKRKKHSTKLSHPSLSDQIITKRDRS
jgi:cell division protein FtsB